MVLWAKRFALYQSKKMKWGEGPERKRNLHLLKGLSVCSQYFQGGSCRSPITSNSQRTEKGKHTIPNVRNRLALDKCCLIALKN